MANDFLEGTSSFRGIYDVSEANVEFNDVASSHKTGTNHRSASVGMLKSHRDPSLDSVRLERSLALLDGKEEYDRLQKEHQHFAQKELSEGLSEREQLQYEMVLWNLDRIEDAEMGPSLDMLEQISSSNAQLESQVRQLVSVWTSQTSGKHRHF